MTESIAMNKKKIALKVSRFDPALDHSPRFQEYVLDGDVKMTVLSALQHIYEHLDGSLSINGYFCYRKLCSLCMLRINGNNRLSCRVLAEDNMVIEPADGYPVIKDLVVNFGEFKGRKSR